MFSNPYENCTYADGFSFSGNKLFRLRASRAFPCCPSSGHPFVYPPLIHLFLLFSLRYLLYLLSYFFPARSVTAAPNSPAAVLGSHAASVFWSQKRRFPFQKPWILTRSRAGSFSALVMFGAYFGFFVFDPIGMIPEGLPRSDYKHFPPVFKRIYDRPPTNPFCRR